MSDKTKGVDNEFFKGEDMSGMDKLDIIFAMQEKFDQDVIKNRGLQDVTPEEWIQKQTLAMLSELAELIAEVNFKWWKNPKPVVTDNVREELVDILHFFVGMCNRSGMGSEEKRRANISGAYRVPDPELIEGKRVLLIDDIVTTGSTLSECARVLREAGAQEVLCVTLARVR